MSSNGLADGVKHGVASSSGSLPERWSGRIQHLSPAPASASASAALSPRGVESSRVGRSGSLQYMYSKLHLRGTNLPLRLVLPPIH